MHLIALVNAAIEVFDALLWVWAFARRKKYYLALFEFAKCRIGVPGILRFHDSVAAKKHFDKCRQR